MLIFGQCVCLCRSGAGFQGRAEIADMLVGHGLSVHDMHEDGFTPFHRACWGIELRHTDTVETFLNHGVNATVLSKDGKSCLDMTTNKETKRLIRMWISRQGEKQTGNKEKEKKKRKKNAKGNLKSNKSKKKVDL